MKYISLMTGKKPPKSVGLVRKTFADHVKVAMSVRFKDSPNKPMSLAKSAGISLSSVQRAISGETAPTLDTVEAISIALRVGVCDLLCEKKTIPRKTGTHG